MDMYLEKIENSRNDYSINIISMMNNIKNYYYNNDYVEALELLDKYFKLYNVGVTDKILDIYIGCLINLGKIDDAKRHILLMIETFPKYYSSYSLGIRYCQCNDIDKLREIINLNDLYGVELYYLGKMCYYNQYYDEASMLFNKFLSGTKNNMNNEAKEYLLKIKLHNEQKNLFREESFLNFKFKKKKLEPGHVIYVDKVRYRDNINQDPKCDRRPYMIWKIDGEKIYCFPIASSINKRYKYVLYARNYPHIGFDRIVKDTLVCVSCRDVTKVIDKIRDDDYESVIQNIYNSICYNDDRKNTNQLFINSVLKNFNVDNYDILSIYDVKLKKIRLYFIINKDIKNKKYKTIEVKYNENGELEVVNYNIDIISFEESVLNVTKLEQDLKNKLLEKIPLNYKKVNMLGKVVQYDNHELEIILEEDKYYLCLDRTVSYLSRDVDIYFLRKDVPLFSLFGFSGDRYQTHLKVLKEYINNNYWKFSQRKQEYMVRRKN